MHASAVWILCLFCGPCGPCYLVISQSLTEFGDSEELPEVLVEDGEDAAVRSLAVTSNLPSQLLVEVGTLAATQNQDLDVVAGLKYTDGLRISIIGDTFATSLNGVAKVRVVVHATQANIGNCDSPDFYRAGGRYGFVGQALTLNIDVNGTARTAGAVSFMLGGRYRLCYSHDGSFTGANSEIVGVPSSLDVRGARIQCSTDSCLENYDWACFVYSDALTPLYSCSIRFTGVANIPNPHLARLSVGTTVTTQTSGTAQIGWECNGTAPSDKVVSGYRPPNVGTIGREFSLQAENFGKATTGFSVQACYCPEYDGADADSTACNHDSEFVQPVGRIYFYYTRPCDDLICTNEYAVVHPDSPFMLHMECAGTDACNNTIGNRIKLIDSNPLGVNDRPSWATNAGCRSAFQTSNYWRPPNCQANVPAQCGGTAGAMNGGSSTSLKIFQKLVMGPTYVSGVSMTRLYDVCYCDDQCDVATSADAATRFRKVGRVRISPVKLKATNDAGQNTGLTIVGVIGDIMVEGEDMNIPLVPQAAQVKMLWDNLRSKTSTACAGLADIVSFSPGEGPTCAQQDRCGYRAANTGVNPNSVQTGKPTTVFFNDGGTLKERWRFNEVGVLAVCYCGVLEDGSGSQQVGDCIRETSPVFSYWTLMVRTLIRGPCVVNAQGICVEQYWNFDVGIVFRIEIKGMGLRSTDKVRIIPENDNCRNNPDGGGEVTVLKGCPASCSPLNLPNTYLYGGGPGKDDIDVQITSETTVGCSVHNTDCQNVRILEITPDIDHTVWRFETDPLLQDGDVVVLDNVTGGTVEENQLMAGQIGLEHVGWPITRLSDPRKVRVPAYLPPAWPVFTSDGRWHRYNLAVTRQELRATTAKQSLQVCWGSGPDTYHKRAGRINFRDPARMSSALTSLSGFEQGRRSPAIVSFTTAAGGAVGLRYKYAVNSMQLRLKFEVVSQLVPMYANSDADPLPTSPPVNMDELPEAKQFACGQLFLELWSTDTKGFPLPRGCFYSAEVGGKRELHIVFDPKNGLETGQTYQIVLNARASAGASSAENLLSVWSMDDVVTLPYTAVEVGDARLSRSPVAPSGVGEPRFMAAGGFTLLDATGQLRDLIELQTNPVSLLFRLQGDGLSRITAESRLRIFLRPLTVWNIRATCLATCFPHRTLVCGQITFCQGESVVVGSQRNVVHLQLPTVMDDIFGSTVQHTVRVSELTLPDGGFFGTRIAAQISDKLETRVHYIESSGSYIWKPPRAQNPQVSVASVVNARVNIGDGDDRPFRGQVSNTLYVRVMLGASLRSELQDADAYFQITLPIGYTCEAVQSDTLNSSLAVFGQSWPQGRGSLRTVGISSDGGEWKKSANTCRYNLKNYSFIPAKTSIFMKLSVTQPATPLQKTNVMNKWYLGIGSKGWYRKASSVVPDVDFVDDGNDYVRNVAVLGRLTEDNVQPISFVAGDGNNALHIFFQPEQKSGYSGTIQIVAPFGFNFATLLPDRCQPTTLDSAYYRKAGAVPPTRYLPIVSSCISDCSGTSSCPGVTYNRAKITLQNSLEPGYIYGVKIFLINSATYAAGDDMKWQMLTTDSSDNLLDASHPVLRLNNEIGGDQKSWGIYAAAGTTIPQASFSSLVPFTATQALSSLTIAPIDVPTMRTNCRLLLPAEYVVTPVNFVYHYASVPGSSASWPAQTPWQSAGTNPGQTNPHGNQARNVLLWEAAQYNLGERYGFIVKVKIPDYPSAKTSAMVLLQFGWNETTLANRKLAFTMPIPPLRTLVNFEISHRTNVVNLVNFVSMFLQTATDVPVDGKIQLHAPEGVVFEERCVVVQAPGQAVIPVRMACTSYASTSAQGAALGTTITFSPIDNALVAGYHVFGLASNNPVATRSNRAGQQTPCTFERCWTASTLTSSGALLDTSASTPGFAINRQMPEAKLLDLNSAQRLATGRDDRPGAANDVIFAFRLLQRPSSPGSLVLKGPTGFVFDEDCLSGFRVRNTQLNNQGVFGTLSWMLGYTPWEQAAQVRSCVGAGSTATIFVELGLRAAKLYPFRIHVATNPMSTPNPNSWTLQYADESSIPFTGFSLWTFTDFNLNFTIAAASTQSLQTPNPVTITFRPHKQLNYNRLGTGSGGMLRVLAPSGFTAVTQGALGQTCADYSLTEALTMFVPSTDLLCTLEQGKPHIMSFALIGNKDVEAGRLYTLVVQYYNPSTVSNQIDTWTVATFSDTSGAIQAALDSTRMAGEPINTPMFRWTVTPPTGLQHADAAVNDVSCDMAFPADLVGGDEIFIRAPRNFTLSAPKQCKPEVGSILSSSRQSVGFSNSLIQCADVVTRTMTYANAASWNTLTTECYAHVTLINVDICGPVNTTTTTTLLSGGNSSGGRRMQAATTTTTTRDCSTYVFHVCTFNLLNTDCHKFAFVGQTTLQNIPVCVDNTITFRLAPGEVVTPTTSIPFIISTRNPQKRPDLVDDWWIAKQFSSSMVLKSSQSARSWDVIPVLKAVTIRLTGNLKASGSFSELTVQFTAASLADEIKVTALQPPGFDFSAVTLDPAGGGTIKQTAVSSVSINRVVYPNSVLNPPIVIRNLKLSQPGPTSFSVLTFYDSLTADEILSVQGAAAFIMPGSITVESRQLLTNYSLSKAQHPYRAGFQPRANDLAVANFTLRFGADVAVGDYLLVSAPPFIFPANGLFELSIIDSQGVVLTKIGTQISIVGGGSTIHATTLAPVAAGSRCILKFSTRTGNLTNNGEMWLIETWSAVGGPGVLLPTNTNDRSTTSFGLVRTIALSLVVGRVAPTTDAPVQIIVDPKGSDPNMLMLYAPVGFEFRQGSCLKTPAGPNSKILSCRRLGGKNIAELQLQGSGLKVAAQTTVVAKAPDLQPNASKNMWLLQAKTGSVEKGWCESAGFAVVQMTAARIIYGGAPSFKTYMGVVFETSQRLLNGGRIELRAPEVYKLSCRISEGYNTLSVQGVQDCDDAGTGRLALTLNSTMAPGEYAFIFGATNPAYTPAMNVFSLLLQNVDGNVVDGRMQFPGNRIIQGLYVRPPVLSFSSSSSKALAIIQVSFIASAALDPTHAIGAVRALQIGIPERFTLMNSKAVVNLDGLITPEHGWYHYYTKSRLVRIDILSSQTAQPKLIPAGTYRIQFEVEVPEFWMPNVNLWLLSLCRDVRCTDLIATLPTAGFKFGDAPTLSAGGSSTGASGTQSGHANPSARYSLIMTVILPLLIASTCRNKLQ